MNKRDNQCRALIFSKDRALQLMATIESFYLNCKDYEDIELTVLYKASNNLHQDQYRILENEFKEIDFVKERDFREDVLSFIKDSEYILFLVDDNIFVREFKIKEAVEILEKNKEVLSFSLRLGMNTYYCYPLDKKQNLPEFIFLNEKVLKFRWVDAEYDFNYPLEVSSSLYKTSDIFALLKEINLKNPNIMEAEMASNKHRFKEEKPYLLCYPYSVTFANPVNKVQNVFDNRDSGIREYSAKDLAEIFKKGYKIDVEKYLDFIPNACHQERELYFKKR